MCLIQLLSTSLTDHCLIVLIFKSMLLMDSDCSHFKINHKLNDKVHHYDYDY